MLFAGTGMALSSCGGNEQYNKTADENVGKYKMVYQISQQQMEDDSLYYLTLNEKFINTSLLQKKYLPARTRPLLEAYSEFVFVCDKLLRIGQLSL